MASTKQQTAYFRVATDLQARILSGEWETGGQLPTEAELRKQYGVSRSTMRRAFQIIEEKALVRRRPGSGTFTSPGQAAKIPIRNLDLPGGVTRFAPEMERRVIEWGWTKAPEDVAEILQQNPNAPVLYAVRMSSLGGRAVSTSQNWLVLEFARRMDESSLAQLNFLEEWMRIEGHTVDYCTQCIEVELADSRVASILDIAEGETVIRESEIMNSDSRPAGYFVCHYLPEVFRFEATYDMRLLSNKS